MPSPRAASPSPPPPSRFPTPHERAILRAAAAVAPLWFAGQLAFNVSLTATSVTSNTVLSSTAAAVTHVASVLILKEKATLRKGACVALTVAGVAAVAAADGATRRADGGGGARASLAGDALTLLAAGLYAAYTITLRKMLGGEGGAGTVRERGEEERGGGGDGLSSPLGVPLVSNPSSPSSPPQMLFFGFLGLVNLVAGAPIVLIAALATHARAPPGRLLAAALGKGLLDNALSDYLWARAVLLVGPTVASVGLNAQVPLAAGLDAAFGVPRPPWTASAGAAAATAAGAVAVVGGVVGIALAPE